MATATGSAALAKLRTRKLTYPEWRDRVDEFAALQGFRARQFTELHLRAIYATGMPAGSAAERLVAQRQGSRK